MMVKDSQITKTFRCLVFLVYVPLQRKMSQTHDEDVDNVDDDAG